MQVEQEGHGRAVASGRGLKGLWAIPVLLVAFRAKGLSSESRPKCQLITVDTRKCRRGQREVKTRVQTQTAAQTHGENTQTF